MPKLLSSTDLAIAVAIRANTLQVTMRRDRFGDPCIFISDDVGLIEVHATMDNADKRIADIKAAIS